MSLANRVMRLAEGAPVLGALVRSVERKMYFRHLQRVREAAGDRAVAATGGVIAGGLFAGVRIGERTSWGQDRYTTINGQYERELQAILGCARELDYRCFVDVGCANGFYAVGMARVAPAARVFAYDIDPAARRATAANARLNDVADRVEVGGTADAAELAERIRLHGPAFVISDVEGAELDLLDPGRAPALLEAELLIELHGDMPAAIAEFARRFGATHRLFVIGRLPRSPFDDAFGGFELEDDAWVSVSEGRGFVRDNWLFAVRRGMLAPYRPALDAPHVRPL